jgi:hypothetical protein
MIRTRFLVVTDLFNTEYRRVGGNSNKISFDGAFVTRDIRSIVLGTVLHIIRCERRLDANGDTLQKAAKGCKRRPAMKEDTLRERRKAGKFTQTLKVAQSSTMLIILLKAGNIAVISRRLEDNN